MKKIILFAAAVCFMISAWAQFSPSYTLNGQTSTNFDFYAGISSRIVARENGQLLLTARTTKKILILRTWDDIMVRWVDKDLDVLKEYVLPDSRDYELLTTTVADNEVTLLVKIFEKKEMTVKRIVLDKSTLQPKGEHVLYTHEADNAILATCATATSEDGDFTALLAVAGDRKGNGESRMLLLDDHLDKLWDRESNLPDCYGLWVSNEGDVYMASADDNKVLFAKLTDDDNYQYYAQIPGSVSTLRLLNVIDDCIVVGGTYTSDDPKKKNHLIGYFGMSYSMKTGKLAGSEIRPFSTDEVMVINNMKNNSRNRDYCDPLWLSNHTATAFGGAMVLANVIHFIERNPNGGYTESYAQCGLLTFGVNTQGKLVWSYTIRHLENAPIYTVFSQPMVADGNNVYLILSEDNKASLEYSTAKVQKNKNPLSKANDLVMYSFDEKGMTGKTIVASKQKGVLSCKPQRWFNGHYYLIHSNNKKGGLMTIYAQ